jgi:hypothetical protein
MNFNNNKYFNKFRLFILLFQVYILFLNRNYKQLTYWYGKFFTQKININKLTRIMGGNSRLRLQQTCIDYI